MNSRIIILSLLLLISIISVNAQSIDVLESSITVELSQSSSTTSIINIRNIGTSSFTVEFNISELSLKDNDGDEVLVLFSDPGTIDPNETAQSTITITTPNLIDFETFGGIVKVRIQNSTEQDTFTLQISVVPDVCDFGQQGNALVLDIEDPDSDDSFGPGDEVNVKINVENTGIVDVRTQGEAFLFTEDGREIASCATQVMNIENGEDEDFQCSLAIPFDPNEVEEDEDLRLFVKAFDDDNEQAQCTQKSIPLDVEIATKELIISKRNTKFVPNSLSCNDLTFANIQIINTGKKDNEAQIIISNRELGINLKSEKISIESFSSDEENTVTKQFEIKIPESAKIKDYIFDVKVNFEGGTATTTMPLSIVSCETAPKFIIQDFASQAFVKPFEDKFTARSGGFLSIPIDITNNLNRQSIFIIQVKNIGDFAEASSKQIVLQPGQKITTFIEMLIKDDIEPSVYSGVIEVRAGSNVVFSSPVNVEIQEQARVSESKEIFRRIPLWFWVVVNIALIGLVMISIKIVTKSKRK